MDDPTDAPTRAGSIIPELYYDLIARVCSGLPVVILLLADKYKDIATTLGSPVVGALLSLVAAYLIGFVLTPPGLIWALPVAWMSRRALPRRDPAASGNRYLALYDRTDAIAARNAAAGVTLAKMQAEAVLVTNLFTGFLFLLVLHASGTAMVQAFTHRGAVFFLIVGTVLLLCAWHRQFAYLVRQESLYGLYVSAA